VRPHDLEASGAYFAVGPALKPKGKMTVYQCEFERLCQEQSVDAENLEQLASNPTVVSWIDQNKNRRYVPERLLSKLGIEVEEFS
jgi:hypothetical protein